MKNMIPRFLIPALLGLLVFVMPESAAAQAINIDLGGQGNGTVTGRVVQLVVLLTVLSLAPSILIMMTSFTRIVVVLSFLRTAIGIQQTPPNTVMISLALFLTFFIMAPTLQSAYESAVVPLINEEIDEIQAFEQGVVPFKEFMSDHVRPQDLELFMQMSETKMPERVEDVPLQVLIPSFMISELRRAFEIGFMLFLPFLIIDLALQGSTPFWLAASRVMLAAVALGAFWLWRGGRVFSQPARKKDWVNVCFIAAFNTAVPFALLSWGQQFVASGFAGVSMASGALFALPLAHFFVPGERIGWRRTVGFVLGFSGVVILIGPRAFGDSGADMELWGQLACVLASMCYATSGVLTRRLPPVDPLALSSVLLVISACYSIPLAFIAEGAPQIPDVKTIFYITLLGLFPTAAAIYLRVLIVRSAGPVFMSLVGYQVPIWSVLLGALVLNERLPITVFYGAAFILVGMALSQSRNLWPLVQSLFNRSIKRSSD